MLSSWTLRKRLTQSHTNISSLSLADMVSMVRFSSGWVISCKIVSNMLFWKVKAQTGPWFTLVSLREVLLGQCCSCCMSMIYLRTYRAQVKCLPMILYCLTQISHHLFINLCVKACLRS